MTVLQLSKSLIVFFFTFSMFFIILSFAFEIMPYIKGPQNYDIVVLLLLNSYPRIFMA